MLRIFPDVPMRTFLKRHRIATLPNTSGTRMTLSRIMLTCNRACSTTRGKKKKNVQHKYSWNLKYIIFYSTNLGKPDKSTRTV